MQQNAYQKQDAEQLFATPTKPEDKKEMKQITKENVKIKKQKKEYASSNVYIGGI